MMTQEQLERKVERYIDHLDRVLLAGQIDQATYDKTMRAIHAWAEAVSMQTEICERHR
jgi:hypothetical protein